MKQKKVSTTDEIGMDWLTTPRHRTLLAHANSLPLGPRKNDMIASNTKNCLNSRLNPNISIVLDDNKDCDEAFSSIVTISPLTIFVFAFLDDMEMSIETDTRAYEWLCELRNIKV